jgi:hypothetical protein
MAVQSITLLNQAVSLAPGTYRRPNPDINPLGAGVPAPAAWYKIVIDVSAMLDPGTHFEFRGEFCLDGNSTRTVSDGVTVAGEPVVTSATALFTQADIGKSVNHPNVPTGAVIQSVETPASVTMSQASTASGVLLPLVIGPTWFQYGGGGRDGGQGFDRQGNPLSTCAFFAGRSTLSPNELALPGVGLPQAQRRARALLVTSGGTFTIGPVTVFGGTATDTPPANT